MRPRTLGLNFIGLYVHIYGPSTCPVTSKLAWSRIGRAGGWAGKSQSKQKILVLAKITAVQMSGAYWFLGKTV